MSYSFKRKDRSNCSTLELAELVEKTKEEYDLEVEKNKGKTKYDYRRKRHVPIKPSTGFIVKAVRQFYGDLKNAKNSVATRFYNEIFSLRDPSSCPPKKRQHKVQVVNEKLLK